MRLGFSTKAFNLYLAGGNSYQIFPPEFGMRPKGFDVVFAAIDIVVFAVDEGVFNSKSNDVNNTKHNIKSHSFVNS